MANFLTKLREFKQKLIARLQKTKNEDPEKGFVSFKGDLNIKITRGNVNGKDNRL